jgi:excinuclease ABC subunit C
MAIRELKDQIARLPEQPGVYLYFNAAGETIYVGKARALRDRVRNYLGAYGADVKTDALLDEVARLEVILTDSVVEALALENNLIKQRSPKTSRACLSPAASSATEISTRGHSCRRGSRARQWR